MYTTDLDTTHEFIGASVYSQDEGNCFGKVTDFWTDSDGIARFKTDAGYHYTTLDVESFDMDETITVFD